MIRLSKITDREGLIVLWQEAFGDSREAIEFFLERRFFPDNTLVAEENGRIASMLFLFDGEVKADDKLLKAYYLYAAATLKEFRGKGIMAAMLKEAETLARNRRVDLICLKPAEKSLYDFYKKHGYLTAFSTKTVTLKTDFGLLSDKEVCNDMFAARETVFEDYNRFVWDKSSIGFAVEQHKYYLGKVYERCEGYCLYNVKGSVCYVKEMSFTPSLANNVLSEIATVEQVNEFRIELPCAYPLKSESCIISDNGMALLLSDNAHFIASTNDLYLNLTLD